MKLKVGKNLNRDIEVLKAIRVVHPDCLFILDANEGYTSDEAILVLERLRGKQNMILQTTIFNFIALGPLMSEKDIHPRTKTFMHEDTFSVLSLFLQCIRKRHPLLEATIPERVMCTGLPCS